MAIIKVNHEDFCGHNYNIKMKIENFFFWRREGEKMFQEKAQSLIF